MKLNRALIKTQAKELIRGKWFSLFIIIFIVFLVSGMLSATSNAASSSNVYSNADNAYSDKNYSYDDDYDDFDDYLNGNNQSENDNPIDGFSGNITTLNANISPTSTIFASISSALGIITFVLSATFVTMTGYFVVFIRTGRDIPLGADISAIFKNTFDKTYWHKLLVLFLRNLFMGLLSILLVVPGIIYLYSTRFAFELMCDHPNLSPTEAGKLSRKIVSGNRSELFVLDLSFIPWAILMFCTLGIAGIYVLPYYFTTRALYYENFVRRALADGKITEDDFISQVEKQSAMAGAFNGQPNNNAYQQPNATAQQGTYYQPQSQDATNANTNYSVNNAPYYQPPQPTPANQSGEGTANQATPNPQPDVENDASDAPIE